jgi:FSR family fosmidomycin resistance protein-like MFS transporter
LGRLADGTSIEFVYRLCAYLPALGLLTAWLPDLETGSRLRRAGQTSESRSVTGPVAGDSPW